MANFDYILSITGDCSYAGVGAITIEPFGGTPPYTIEWVSPSIPPINTVGENGTSSRGGLFPGTYQIRLNDSSAPVNFAFDVNAIVSSGLCTSILTVSASTCGTNNGSVTASATTYLSAVNFELFASGGTLVDSYLTDTAQVEFTSLSAGSYYIVATDIGGCSAKTQDFIILNSNPLNFGLYVVPNSACSPLGDPTGKIYVTGQTGTPPYTYLWSNNLTGSSITGLSEGFYSVTVTDANGCTNSENTEIINVDQLSFLYFSAQTPSCFASDGALKLFITGGTGPYYYSASTGEVLISYSQNFLLNNIPAGNYSFIVTDAGLCQTTAATNLQTPQSIGLVEVLVTNSTCSLSDGSIEVTVGQGVGPFTYTLVYPDSSNKSVTTELPNYIFSNLSTGNYDIFVQNSEACVYSQSVSILTDNLFSLTLIADSTTCGIPNGVIYAEISTGGTAPYTYSIDQEVVYTETNLSAVTISNVALGSHQVSVSDANGCVQKQFIYVGGTVDMNFSLFSTDCGNGSDGQITAFISSGVPPFTFTWSDNVLGNPQSISVSNLSAGTYTLTIQDSNGCSLERSTEITCAPVSSGYVPYEVGAESLQVTVEETSGLSKMLNDGYLDLTGGNPNCSLETGSFIAKVTVNPVGLLLENNFYVSTSLVDIPASNLYYGAVESMISTIPGVESVNVDVLTGEIEITKSSTSNYLNGQVINIALAIEYVINC